MASREIKGGVDAALTVGAILKGMLSMPHPFRITELAQASGIPAPKLHRYLVSMAQSGLVAKTDTNRYTFGLLAMQLGRATDRHGDFVSLVSPRLEQLAANLNESVGLALWRSNGATVVRWFSSGRDVSVSLRPNSVLGLTTSSTGSVFGAWLPRTVTEPLVRHELEDPAEVQVEAAYKAFAKVAKTGVARGLGTRVRGIHSLSAPIFDHAHELVACITALGPEGRFDVSSEGLASRMLEEEAYSISSQLGAKSE